MGAFLTLSTSAAAILLVIRGGLCVDIIGGHEVVPHSRPFMALIQGANKNLICGGALIKEDWVLTAAHCKPYVWFSYKGLLGLLDQGVIDSWFLYQRPPAGTTVTTSESNKDGGQVVLGAHSHKEKEKEKQFFQIAKQIRHPCYCSSCKENDLMLLQLQKRARITKAVQVIHLPKSGDDPKPRTTCTVAGWGRTHNRQRRLSDTLREVNITVISRKICNDNSHYKNNPVITDNMICAGDENGGKDSCNGDSGGPLICNNTLRGITAFGKQNKCGAVDGPGVYTRLTKQYLQWIRKTIGGA